MVKNLSAIMEMQEMQVQSLGQEDSLRRTWQPTPVFLPGEFQGQRSLAGYSPWSHKESDIHGCNQLVIWFCLSILFCEKVH